MTLDEAIKHCEEVVEENQAIVDACDYYGDNMAKCEECAKEHKQLARWLRELKALKQQKTGHWIHDGSNWTNRWICPECGYKLCYEQSRFCPGCGARMEAKNVD